MTTVLATTRHRGSLLNMLDLSKPQFLALLDRAATLKLARTMGSEVPQLSGKNIALIFEKRSTRTRSAFEVAASDQGAHVTYLGPDGSHMGVEESIADTARVLGRMFDGIEFRGFEQSAIEQLAALSGVPVWNGLTDSWHPTQMLADVLTMMEHHAGSLESIVVCFTGDGRNNVARSLLVTAAVLGFDVRIAAPPRLWPPAEILDTARQLASVSGARITVTADASAGVAGADFIYTDVWVSMGESAEEWDRRVPELLPYRVTDALTHSTGNPLTKFMHCLPAIHDTTTAIGKRVQAAYGLVGAEVTDDVFESPRSIVFDQAENRLHTIKAVLVAAWDQ